MKIHVAMYANLRKYAPGDGGSFNIDLASGSTVGKLLNILEIPQTVKIVMLINGRTADADSRLAPEDKITLFPPHRRGMSPV